MKGWGKELVHASSAAYLLMALAALGDKPLLLNLTKEQNIVFGLLAAGAIQLPMHYKWLRLPFTYIYGAGAMAAFSGISQWYPDTQVTGPAMAAWDLALAVAFSEDE